MYGNKCEQKATWLFLNLTIISLFFHIISELIYSTLHSVNIFEIFGPLRAERVYLSAIEKPLNT